MQFRQNLALIEVKKPVLIRADLVDVHVVEAAVVVLPDGLEVAFGVGPDPFDFVLVLGLQLPAGSGVSAATVVCEVLSSDGIRSEPTRAGDGSVTGCRMADGAIVAGTPEGAVVVASRAELVKGLLGRPDLGDRLGFSGPSVRGVAPEVGELGRETSTLVQRLSAKYP